MNKILVLTDFTVNSEAALRFAIQLGSQQEVALCFLHMIGLMRPPSWPDSLYAEHQQRERVNAQLTLEQLVKSIYQRLGISPGNHSCEIENGVFSQRAVLDYADAHRCDYICLSTRGGGRFEKLFGTTATNLIGQSNNPVITVPGHYQQTPLTSILYATDLTNLETELRQVVEFARPLAAKVSLLHFSQSSILPIDTERLQLSIRNDSAYPVEVHLQPLELKDSIIASIELAIERIKPSLVIMFTTQPDGFFCRWFASSHSIDYSFIATVPLLVLTKTVPIP